MDFELKKKLHDDDGMVRIGTVIKNKIFKEKSHPLNSELKIFI